MGNQAKKIEPKPNAKFKAERDERWPEDIWGIRIYIDDEPGPWVHWIETGMRPFRIVRSHGIQSTDGTVSPCGWTGAKSQAIHGSEKIQKLWDEGDLE